MFLHPSKRSVITAAIVLLCSTAAFTQGLRWTKAAPFPEPDEELYGVTANGKRVLHRELDLSDTRERSTSLADSSRR